MPLGVATPVPVFPPPPLTAKPCKAMQSHAKPALTACHCTPRLCSQVFARKLYEILESEPPDAIAWTPSGTSFVIKDMEV